MFAPLVFGVAAFVMLFQGLRLLFSNWRRGKHARSGPVIAGWRGGAHAFGPGPTPVAPVRA